MKNGMSRITAHIFLYIISIIQIYLTKWDENENMK